MVKGLKFQRLGGFRYVDQKMIFDNLPRCPSSIFEATKWLQLTGINSGDGVCAISKMEFTECDSDTM